VIAVVVTRDGSLPVGALETVEEAGGRVLLAGTGTAEAAEALAAEGEALCAAFRPLDALREYRLWATGQPSELGRWKEVKADWRMLPLYLVTVLSRTISSALFAAFLFGTPWRAWREGRRSAVARAGLAVWLLYLGWYTIYAVVHVETRYMAPVLPFAILFGVANLLWLRRGRAEGGGAFGADAA